MKIMNIKFHLFTTPGFHLQKNLKTDISGTGYIHYKLLIFGHHRGRKTSIHTYFQMICILEALTQFLLDFYLPPHF
jgi:hypothetical protein